MGHGQRVVGRPFHQACVIDADSVVTNQLGREGADRGYDAVAAIGDDRLVGGRSAPCELCRQRVTVRQGQALAAQHVVYWDSEVLCVAV